MTALDTVSISIVILIPHQALPTEVMSIFLENLSLLTCICRKGFYIEGLQNTTKKVPHGIQSKIGTVAGDVFRSVCL